MILVLNTMFSWLHSRHCRSITLFYLMLNIPAVSNGRLQVKHRKALQWHWHCLAEHSVPSSSPTSCSFSGGCFLFSGQFFARSYILTHYNTILIISSLFLSHPLSSNSFPNGQRGHMIELLTAAWVERAARGGLRAAGRVTLASMMTPQKYRGEIKLEICPVNTPNTLEHLRAFSIPIR